MHANGPIGLFDSGVGGLTVARALAKALPRESLLYFGDTEHLPYGDKSPEAIRGFSLKIARHLVDQGAKAIVIACNSASAVAFDHLQTHLNVPVFNVIDPVIAAIEASGSKNIAVWGTRATIDSGIYSQRIAAVLPQATIHAMATPLLAPVIEASPLDEALVDATIKFYMTNQVPVDHMVLACTHYPLVADQISAKLNASTTMLNVPSIVATAIASDLKGMGLLSNQSDATMRCVVSDYTESFEAIAAKFMGKGVQLTEERIWD